MAKRYEIELHVDTTRSDAATARSARTVGQVEKAHQKAGEAQERAARRGADAGFISALKLDAQATKLSARIAAEAEKQAAAQERSFKRAADAAARQAKRASDQQEGAFKRAADRAEKEAQRAANAQVREAKRASDKMAQEAQRAEDQKARVAQKAQEAISNLAGRMITAEEARATALGQIHQKMNDKRVALAVKAMEREQAAGKSFFQKASESIGETLGSITPMTAALAAGTAAATFAVSALVEKWADVARGIEKSIKFQDDYRKGTLPLAALKGHLGDTTTEMKEQLLLRSKTLQSQDQAKAFEEQMLNTGVVSIQAGQVTQAEFDKYKVRAGSFQAAQGESAATHGQLAGQMPSLLKAKKDAKGKVIPFTSDELTAGESKLFDILSLGGATFESGTNQLLKNASLSSTGLYKDVYEQAALQSMFSGKTPESAGDLTNQFTRATVGGLGRMRGVQVEGAEKIGPYLKRLVQLGPSVLVE